MSMIAYQIIIKDDPVSEEYAELSRESFRPLTDAGILEIRTFDAITPDSPEFEEHKNRYVWEKSLMKADMQEYGGKDVPMHSPTEIAGMCSHWELMRMQSKTDEMFLVLEHDTWYNGGDIEYFKNLIEIDALYLNIGLFMGCYGFEKETAQYQYELLSERKFPINCGPYCVLNRLFQTYTTRYLQLESIQYRGRCTTAVHPWHHCDTLHLGWDVRMPFNEIDPRRKTNEWYTPTTQVISKHLKVTQDHHSYKDEHIEEPWTRHKLFHIVP